MNLLSPLWLVGLLILVYVAYDVGYQRGYRKGVFSVRPGGPTVESEIGRQLPNNFPTLRFESPFGSIITKICSSYQLLHCLISRNAIILLRLSDSLSTTDLI